MYTRVLYLPHEGVSYDDGTPKNYPGLMSVEGRHKLRQKAGFTPRSLRLVGCVTKSLPFHLPD